MFQEAFSSNALLKSVAPVDEERVLSDLEKFYKEEVDLSEESSDRLEEPSGSPNNLLGLVMHHKSNEGATGSFWNLENESIQLLVAKGLSEEFIFGFDWHWRAGPPFAQQEGKCLTSKWGRSLRELHDNLSREVLSNLSLPFLIVAGACAKAGYCKTSRNHRNIKLMFTAMSSIDFDLEFRDGALKRIVAHIAHPASFFIRFTPESHIPFDASLNLFLWLLGLPYRPHSFKEQRLDCPSRKGGRAPVEEISHYLKIERSEGKTLEIKDYYPAFVSWSEHYLKTNPTMVTEY